MTRDFGKSLCMKKIGNKHGWMKRKIQLILESINQSINLMANSFSEKVSNTIPKKGEYDSFKE